MEREMEGRERHTNAVTTPPRVINEMCEYETGVLMRVCCCGDGDHDYEEGDQRGVER